MKILGLLLAFVAAITLVPPLCFAQPRKIAAAVQGTDAPRAKAREKLDKLLALVGMTADLRVSDRIQGSVGDVRIDIDVALISEAARKAYAAKKLQNNSYPAFKRIYADEFAAAGFKNVSVYINTNPFASR